jgi:hypothetical protein
VAPWSTTILGKKSGTIHPEMSTKRTSKGRYIDG